MSRRIDRINVLIQQELSRIVTEELKDPRLHRVVTLTQVLTSPDVQYATVSVSALGTPEAQAEVMGALASASGLMRRELGRRLDLRRAPELRFVLDTSMAEGSKMLALLDKIQEEGTPSDG